jgi:hypothetical protein
MNKTKQLKAAVLSTIVGVMSPLAMIVPASAATVTWTGAAEEADNTTSNSVNWLGAVLPGTNDTLEFPVSGVYQTVDHDVSSLSLAKFVFSGLNDFDSSKSYSISGESVTLTEGIDAVMEGAGGDHQVLLDVTLGDDVTFMTDGVDTLTVGDDETVLNLDGNELSVDASGGTITLQGIIDGEGAVKLVEGKLNMLAAPSEDFDGVFSVEGGEYITSANATGENVTINGGALKGDTGEEGYLGTVTLNSGSIMPGNSPGCISVDELVLVGGTYEVEINGEARCTEYDSTSVTGDVSLGDGEVALDIMRLASFAPETDTKFAIITYDEDSDVSGYFEGLEDGETVTLAEYTYEIDYDDDNAVTLTVLGTPEAPYTGVGSLLTNPLVTLAAAGAVLVSLGAVRYAEVKKRK